MFRHIGRLALLAILLMPAGTALAERSERFGDYEIHYNAIGTGMLDADVARSYDLVRSRNRGLLTVTVLDAGKPQAARVEAEALNRNDQLRRIAMREVREGDAIYYIGTFGVDHLETLRFRLDIQPRGADREYELRFRQQFFTEE